MTSLLLLAPVVAAQWTKPYLDVDPTAWCEPGDPTVRWQIYKDDDLDLAVMAPGPPSCTPPEEPEIPDPALVTDIANAALLMALGAADTLTGFVAPVGEAALRTAQDSTQDIQERIPTAPPSDLPGGLPCTPGQPCLDPGPIPCLDSRASCPLEDTPCVNGPCPAAGLVDAVLDAADNAPCTGNGPCFVTEIVQNLPCVTSPSCPIGEPPIPENLPCTSTDRCFVLDTADDLLARCSDLATCAGRELPCVTEACPTTCTSLFGSPACVKPGEPATCPPTCVDPLDVACKLQAATCATPCLGGPCPLPAAPCEGTACADAACGTGGWDCTPCYTSIEYCDLDAQVLSPLIAQARRAASETPGLPADTVEDAARNSLTTVTRSTTAATAGLMAEATPLYDSAGWALLTLLVPCDPRQGGGFRPAGAGDECIARGTYSAEPHPAPLAPPASPVPTSSATLPVGQPPQDSGEAPSQCSSSEYHFRTFARWSNGAEKPLGQGNCYPIAAPTEHTFRGPTAVGDSVKLVYDTGAERAVLVVKDASQTFVGFEIRIAGSLVRYESQAPVPAEVTLTFGEIHGGLLSVATQDGVTVGPRLVLTYAATTKGGDVSDWMHLRAVPSLADPGTSYDVKLGSLDLPDGTTAGTTAPTTFALDISFIDGAPGKGNLTIRWSDARGLTPAAVTWTEQGRASHLHVVDLPERASIIVEFDNRPGDTTGNVWVDLGGLTVPKMWLPIGDPPIALARVPSLHVSYRAVEIGLYATNHYGCNEWLTDLIRATRDPSGMVQVCVDVHTEFPGGEILLDGSGIRVHSLPAGHLEGAIGPGRAIHFNEDSNAQGLEGIHAAVEVRGSDLLSGIEFDVEEIVNVTFVPGATVASGASDPSSGCGASAKTDPENGRAAALLEARFAPVRKGGYGAVRVDLGSDTELDLSVQNVETISSDLSALSFRFLPVGGSMELVGDASNGCLGATIRGTMSGLHTMRIAGGGDGKSRPFVIIDDLTGPPYSVISVDFSSPSENCDGDSVLQTVLKKTKANPARWTAWFDVDWPDSVWCGTPGLYKYLGEPEEDDYRLPFGDWYATVRTG